MYASLVAIFHIQAKLDLTTQDNHAPLAVHKQLQQTTCSCEQTVLQVSSCPLSVRHDAVPTVVSGARDYPYNSTYGYGGPLNVILLAVTPEQVYSLWTS